MKSVFYFIYSVFFHIFRIFRVKENRITLLSPHNANFKDSLLYVKNEFALRGDFEFHEVSSNELNEISSAIKFFTVKAFYLATSKYVFLNDTFMPLAKLHFSKKTVIVQLWHGQGVLKKFIMDAKIPNKVKSMAENCAKKYTYIVVSSKNIIPICSGAFGAPVEKFLPFGQPASDGLFNGKPSLLYEKYPYLQGRKLVLYAPTFRDDKKADEEIFDNFDIDYFCRELGDEYTLLVRLHPQIHTSIPNDRAIDVTEYDDVNELIKACDILITDYSSICMDFSMSGKPILFFDYDLEKYMQDRDLYFDYESYVPGKTVKKFDDLIAVIKSKDFGTQRNEYFREYNFDFYDGKSSKRLVDFLLKESK